MQLSSPCESRNFPTMRPVIQPLRRSRRLDELWNIAPGLGAQHRISRGVDNRPLRYTCDCQFHLRHPPVDRRARDGFVQAYVRILKYAQATEAYFAKRDAHNADTLAVIQTEAIRAMLVTILAYSP